MIRPKISKQSKLLRHGGCYQIMMEAILNVKKTNRTHRTAILLAAIFFSCFLYLTGMAAADGAQLTVLYTTDPHGRIVTNEESIGLDVVASIKKSMPGALLIDVGDILHGLPIATLTQGRDVVSLMKRAGYIASAVGNHEFNYGRQILLERAAQAMEPPHPMYMMSANVTNPDGTYPFTPWVVLEQNGVKLGLFALTTEETATQANPNAVRDFRFGDATEAALRAVRALRAAGCNFIIAATHIETEESRELADRVPGIDVILGGHSHIVADESRNGTKIYSTGAYGHNVGVLDIARADDGRLTTTNRFISKQESLAVKPDPYIALRTSMIVDEQKKILSEVLASTEVDLNGERHTIRTSETNLGNLTADSLIAATGARISIINGGTIRDSIKRGDITKGDIVTVYPFGNVVVTKRVTGAQMRDILEAALSHLPEAKGSFPQIGGMIVQVDANAPPGNRVKSLRLTDGSPIDEAASYLLATNDFLANGGDGYPHLADRPIESQNMSMDEALISFIRERGTAQYETSSPARILFNQ